MKAITPEWQRAADAAKRFDEQLRARRIPSGVPHAAQGSVAYPIVRTVSAAAPTEAVIEAAGAAGLRLLTQSGKPSDEGARWAGELCRSEWVGRDWSTPQPATEPKP